MTEDEFIEGYCARFGISRESLARLRVAVPCDCGGPSCPGWMMIPGPDRLAEALAGPRWTIPSGLGAERILQYITDCAAGKIPPKKEDEMSNVELPPLPTTEDDIDTGYGPVDVWRAEQVRAYATEAVLAERERCAKLCEGMFSSEPYDPEQGIELRAYQECAAAIRSQSKGAV